MLNSARCLGVVIMFWVVVAALAKVAFGAEDPFANAREQSVAWRPAGNIVQKKIYLRGEAQIGERLFYENGKVAEESLFRDGRLEGTVRLFYENGKIFCERPFKEGKLDGSVRYYKENGDLLGESKFQAGTGVLRQFSKKSQGLPEEEIPYKDGIIDGTKRTWGRFEGAKGIGCNITQYVNGAIDGWSMVINEDGTLVDSSYFHQDKLHGVFRRFNSTGAIEKDYPKFYIDDKEVSEVAFRDAAKTDGLLAKSLNDDGRVWGQQANRLPR